MDPPQPEFSYFLNRARRDVWRQLVDPYREYVYREPQRGR